MREADGRGADPKADGRVEWWADEPKKKVQQSGTALVTPFDDRGRIDFGAIEVRRVEWQIGEGALLSGALWDDRESATLSGDERKAVTAAVVLAARGRVPVRRRAPEGITPRRPHSGRATGPGSGRRRNPLRIAHVQPADGGGTGPPLLGHLRRLASCRSSFTTFPPGPARTSTSRRSSGLAGVGGGVGRSFVHGLRPDRIDQGRASLLTSPAFSGRDAIKLAPSPRRARAHLGCVQRDPPRDGRPREGRPRRRLGPRPRAPGPLRFP